MIDIAATQPRLHMADGNLAVIGGQGCGKCTGRIALHNHPVWPFPVQYFTYAGQCARRQLIKCLTRLHQSQIVIGHNIRQLQYLIQHAAVLPSHQYATVEPRIVR